MKGKLCVEVRDGEVYAVWYDAKPLPFEVKVVEGERWEELEAHNPVAAIVELEVVYSE